MGNEAAPRLGAVSTGLLFGSKGSHCTCVSLVPQVGSAPAPSPPRDAKDEVDRGGVRALTRTGLALPAPTLGPTVISTPIANLRGWLHSRCAVPVDWGRRGSGSLTVSDERNPVPPRVRTPRGLQDSGCPRPSVISTQDQGSVRF